VNLAIDNERNNSKIIQQKKRDLVLWNLMQDELTIQDNIKKSTEKVNRSLGQLQTELPLQLKEKGESTNRIIEEQTNENASHSSGSKR